MSWDIFAQDLPADARCIEDIPCDFKPRPIGTRAEIAAKIRKAAPSARFVADGSSARIVGPGYSIELGIGNEDSCMGVAFFVRGSNPEAVNVVADILDQLKLRALQTGPGDAFFDRHASLKVFKSWQAYRDNVVRKS